MRVRAKVTMLLALLFTALIGVQWIIQQRLILPRFVELERESARTDMQRVAFAVEREQQALVAQASDWGNWQELWHYMDAHNESFATASLTDISVRTAKIDYMALISSDGHFDWNFGLDSESGKPLAIRLNRTGQLEPIWARAVASGVPVSGLIATDAGVLLASGAPILDGFGHGPARGMVLMGRLLKSAELLRLGTQAQVNLDMQLLKPSFGTTTPLAMARADQVRLTESAAATRIERAFANRSGEPLLTFGISVPRTISRHGAEAVLYSTRLLGAAACIALAALLVLLGRIVLTPLASVTDHAQRIAAADDLSARLNYERSDELGTLARAFDHMVERLSQTRRDLVDRSFASGAAENASGVLHNLGNAMTPLSVNIAALRQELAAVSMDDLQLALEELRMGTADAARGDDLQQFVQLSATELAHALQLSRERLHQIVDQTHVIEAVLVEQRQHPNRGPVLQVMTPAELMARSLDHVAPVHRKRLDVAVTPAFAALGPLSMPCTTLGMVLQNLAQNAAEAAAQAGLPRTHLRVDAALVATAGHTALRMTVSDDAAGIAAEDLAKLFQKGFSTKSQLANSGLGLHWCANTLHALGGHITAHSDGRGRGARFEFQVPLRAATPTVEEQAA